MIIELKESIDIQKNSELREIYVRFDKITKELKKRDLPPEIIESINKDIEIINSTSLTGNDLSKLIKDKQTKIMKLIKKELRIVPKDYYRKVGPFNGLVPGNIIGLAFAHNTAVNVTLTINITIYLATVAIGMIIGYVLGKRMDEKAFEERRQLDF